MKTVVVMFDKNEKEKVDTFVEIVNKCPDTVAFFCGENFHEFMVIAAVGKLAMEYTLRKLRCTIKDYSITTIK